MNQTIHHPWAELHAHLYGMLNTDDLRWLASRKTPRWSIFMESYKNSHGEYPNTENLFDGDERNRSRLENYYFYKDSGNFSLFQTSFDLVISLAHTDPEELHEISRRVFMRQKQHYAEYRMILPVRSERNEYREKLHALCDGMAEENRAFPGREMRLILGLPREKERYPEFYDVIRESMNENETVRRMLVGIDFAAMEEGHPPKEKANFIKMLIEKNRVDADRALAILYHVGESYNDKTVESAVRWIVEAAEMGAHRLGHAVALGVNPRMYLHTVRTETSEERRDHIDFLLMHRSSLREHDIKIDEDLLDRERKHLMENQNEIIKIYYDEARIEELKRFQNWSMDYLRKTNVVIESCPTSNLRIAGLSDPENHPLRRFIDQKLPVVIGADDPGILDITLEEEFERIVKWDGITKEDIDDMKRLSVISKAEMISGRRV